MIFWENTVVLGGLYNVFCCCKYWLFRRKQVVVRANTVVMAENTVLFGGKYSNSYVSPIPRYLGENAVVFGEENSLIMGKYCGIFGKYISN